MARSRRPARGPSPSTSSQPADRSSEADHGNQATGDAILREGTGSAGAAPGNTFASATSGGGGEVPYKAKMEAAFGQDFSGVSAHTGQSGLSSMGANAAAKGDTVAFAESSPSAETVAHELTHVVQSRQSGSTGSVQGDAVSSPSSTAEQEASRLAPAAARGERVTVRANPGASIQREDEEEEAPDYFAQWREKMEDPNTTEAQVIEAGARLRRITGGFEVSRRILADDTLRAATFAKISGDACVSLMLYWDVGTRDEENVGLDEAVKWVRDAGGLTAGGWGRLVAGKTSDAALEVVHDAAALALVKALGGDPVVKFPPLSQDPFALQEALTVEGFLTWLTEAGGEERVRQIQGHVETASNADEERQRMVTDGTWAAHLQGLPTGPTTNRESSAKLWHWFLVESNLQHMYTLFMKRFNVDLQEGDDTLDHTVVRGDTLWGLARRYLGDGSRWPEIYDYGDNKDTIGDDPNLIEPGQELRIKTGTFAWDHTSIKRTWLVCDMLPPADVATNANIIRTGNAGGAGGAAGGGEITMYWGTDQIGDQEVGSFTDADDPMRGLNVFDATMRHEIGHDVGENGIDRPPGWVASYGWKEWDGAGAIKRLFKNIFMPVHALNIPDATVKENVLTALSDPAKWNEEELEKKVDAVEGTDWDTVKNEPLIVYILSRVESWETIDAIGSDTHHAPYDSWDLWQAAPTTLYQKKVSTYAMRSSMEWFAEVYATYYADADRPEGEVGSLLRSRDAALATDFTNRIHGRHNLAVETGQNSTHAPAPASP